MADPLSVISAIASVIQLIDFSTKLLSRLNEYRSKGNELPASFTHIDRQLPLLREILEQSKLGIESQSISDREVKAITPCLKGCGEQIGKLNNILDKIVPELQENVVKRMAKGLRSVWKESEVRDIDDRIGEYVKILSFYCAWSSSKLDSRNDKTRAKAQAWLAAPDPYFNLRRALKLRTPNTGDWYLQGAEFQTWKAGVRPFTWLYGAAGSGKSILSAGIIDYLQGDCSNDPAKTLAFWFFDFNDSAKQDPSNMLRSLVSQLLNGCAQVPDSLQSLHTTCENLGRSPSTDDLLLVLKHALERLPTPFIVLDALDECTNRASLFEFIEEMHSWNIAGARVLMTSRKEIDIEEALEDVVPQVAWVGLESNLVDRDIETYVHARLTTDKSFRRWQGHNEGDIREEIETMLGQKANGMFRWAGCQLDVLAQCTTKGKVRRALKELPKTLDETYDRIVRSIEGGENAQEAIKILTWLAYSGEPLDNGQLLEVTGIMLDDEPRFDRDEVLTDPRDLLRICSSLVRMTTLFEYDNHHYEGSDDEKSDDNDSIPDMEGGTDLADGRHEESGGETTDERSVVDVRSITQRRQHVRLAHFSVREYLASNRSKIPKYRLDMAESHDMLSSSCLVYLLQDRTLYPDGRPQSWPLFEYAARQWGNHARASGELSQLQRDFTMDMLIETSPGFQATMRAMVGGCPDKGLCVASFFGLLRAVRRILEDPSVRIDARSEVCSNALCVASSSNHPDVVRALLDGGAEVDWRDTRHCTALSMAARGNYLEIVQILLDRGADTNITILDGSCWSSPLYTATQLGHYEVVQHLMNHGAHVNFAFDDRHVLHIASLMGFVNIVELLLDHSVDVDSPGSDGETSLQAASRRGHLSVVKLLLARGADVNHTGGRVYGNALQAALGDGGLHHKEIVETLLDHGADPDVHGLFVAANSGDWRRYYTARQVVIGQGLGTILELLQEKKVKPYRCCEVHADGSIVCEDDTQDSGWETDFETTSDEHCGGSDMEETAIVEDDGLSVAEQRVAPDTSAAGEDLAAIPLDGEQPSPSPDHQQHNKAQIATDIPQSRNLLDYETNIGIGDNAKHKFNAELPFDIYMMTHHTPLRSTRPSPTHAQATKPPTPADNATNAVTILQ